MKNLKKIGRIILKYLIIIVSAAAYAIAMSMILEPNNLAPGGVSGISIMINYLTGLPVGTLFFVLNIPIMALGIYKFGFKFFFSTIFTVAFTSYFTNVFADAYTVTTDPMLGAIAGGGLMGLSMGVIFKQGSTTGGTDIIVKVLKTKFRHLKTGSLFLAIDTIVVAASALVFENVESALYAGITVFVSSLVFDIVLYGKDEAKLIFIITNHPVEIKERLMYDIDAGVTVINAEGAYTGKNKDMLMCAVKKQTLPKAREIVSGIDPEAFLIVTSATEIFGEGFKSHLEQDI